MFKNTWHKLGLVNEPEIINEEWRLLKEAYSQPNRIYHDINHIDEMIQYVVIKYKDHDTSKNLDFWLLLYMVFYHDFDDTSRLYSEIDSAQKAVAVIIDYHDNIAKKDLAYMTSTVFSGIITTMVHESDIKLFQYLLDADHQRFKDMDKYDPMIRAEYIQHDDSIYNSGRVKVLNSFVNRNPFYYLDTKESNKLAIANIQKAIAKM